MTNRFQGVSTLAIIAVFTLGMGTQATAQDASALPAPDDVGIEQTDIDNAAPADDNVIIVTGEKLGRTLQETTSSVIVYTGEELEARSVDDIYDLVLRTPNVTQSFGEKGFAIRGIDQRFGAGAGLLVTTVVDGAALPNNQATFFGPYSTWDLEQVEILRGPQGTTQGRNAVGGAIIVNTADPVLGEFSGKARGSFAERNTYQAAAALNIPVGDAFALRFSADRRETDGYVFNPTRDEDYDAREFTNLRAKVLFAPGGRFSALYTLNYTDSTGGEDLIDFSQFPDRINRSNDPALEGSESWIHTLELGFDVSDAISLTSISSYYTQDYLRQEDFDLSPADLGNIDRTQNDENFQQEVRLNYDAGGPVRAVIGGFYGRYSSDVIDTVQVPTAFVSPQLPGGSIFQDRLIANDEENMAVFGEVEFDVSERLTLIAGARYDSESRDNSALSETSAIADDPMFQPFLDQVLGQLAPDVLLETDAEYDAFLPKGGLRYRVSEDVTLGFTAQRAYRAGGSGISTISQTVYAFEPEYTWTYEGSLRANTPDDSFSVAANVFYTDWSDQIVNQLIDPNVPQDFIAVNAGQSRLYGAELQFEARPSRTLSVFGALGLLDTEFTDYRTDQAEFDGNAFPYAPPVTVSAGFDYRHPTGFRVLGDANLTADHFGDTINDADETEIVDGIETCAIEPCNSPLVEIPSYVVVNLKAGYEADAFSIYAFARNLFDEDYITQLQPQGDARSAEPRIVGVEVNVGF
ncbi:MAG: TonB-dependent receptor [Erythrobacter sp.]